MQRTSSPVLYCHKRIFIYFRTTNSSDRRKGRAANHSNPFRVFEKCCHMHGVSLQRMETLLALIIPRSRPSLKSLLSKFGCKRLRTKSCHNKPKFIVTVAVLQNNGLVICMDSKECKRETRHSHNQGCITSRSLSLNDPIQSIIVLETRKYMHDLKHHYSHMKCCAGETNNVPHNLECPFPQICRQQRIPQLFRLTQKAKKNRHWCTRQMGIESTFRYKIQCL